MATVSTWSTEDVTSWLGSLSLHHLVPNFERHQIDGSKLLKLSDQDLRGPLRLTKPAEVMAIRGAINKLADDTSRSMYLEHGGGGTRRISASPRLGTQGPPPVRERVGSAEKKTTASRTIPRDHHHRNTIAAEHVPVKQPKLMLGSASELLDRECKYSGWIRKQGGGYKNCEKWGEEEEEGREERGGGGGGGGRGRRKCGVGGGEEYSGWIPQAGRWI